MTKKELEATVKELPDIYDLKVDDLAALFRKAVKSSNDLVEALSQAFDMGVVAGRMWGQYLYEEKRAVSKMLTIKEASERLGVTYRSTLTYVEDGRLPAKKIGGMWRIKEIDLQEFMENR